MYSAIILLLIVLALGLSAKINGFGSFVTLAVLGAGVYTLPAVLDTQVSLATILSPYRRYSSVPDDAAFVAMIAWLALLAGLVVSSALFPSAQRPASTAVDDPRLKSFAVASAVLGVAGLMYLQWIEGSLLFFLEDRGDQNTGGVSILWRWTPLIGLVAASLASSRKLFAVHAVLMLLVFLRGDRTMVAIAASALVVASYYKYRSWKTILTPLRVAGGVLAVLAILFGKSMNISIKSGFAGSGWNPVTLSIMDQIRYHFEPLVTFSHLEYVMRLNITIPLVDFFTSVGANVLLVPSFFGANSNLYNSVVTEALSPRLGFGAAGNYLAHGWAVAGLTGACIFYFILPFMLKLCDNQFFKRTGATKIFWCCVGGVLSFYIHRNGMDNAFSFVRQIFLICVLTSVVGYAILALRKGRAALPVSDSFNLAPGRSAPTATS